MLSCGTCCTETAETFEATPGMVQAERVLPFDDSADRGSFDDNVAKEVFGKCSQPKEAPVEAPVSDACQAPTVGFIVRAQFAKGQTLGMSFDIVQSENLRINQVESVGPIADYNQGVPEDLRVREGDYIMSVNSETGDARAKLAAMYAGGTCVLEIRRPHSFEVSGLDKSQGRLGLDLTFHGKSTAAYIKKVFVDGLIQEYNQAHPERQVRSGDLIVAVNGQRGVSRDLVQMIGSSQKLELTIVRPQDR